MTLIGQSETPSGDTSHLAEALRRAALKAESEEDLRIGFERLLRQELPDLPDGRYEQSVSTSTFRGRADAIHRALVIEYEKPRSLRSKRSRDHAVKQAVDYIEALAEQEQGKNRRKALEQDLFSSGAEEIISGFVGVVTDGVNLIFVQRRGRRWDEDEREVDADSVEKLILWLRSMNRRSLSPENLIEDFGPQTELAAEAVGVLARLVASGKYAKARVVFDEWERIFGIVYGTEQLSRSHREPEAAELAGAYNLEIGVDFPVILFAVHTYYALLMKLLATEVIVAQTSLGDSFIGRLARTKLRQDLRDLEAGKVLERYAIRNAIEQDFFGWYPEAWTAELHGVLWRLVETLRNYDVGTFELRPERTRDLLKDLYHGLIPESVRHALGEYYTPDWLAEHTLDLANYDGDPHKTLLDPSCGSGTFLVFAIQRIRRWLSDRTIEWGDSKQKQRAVSLIRSNIVGFDLNPLAVIASRTNFLFALGPLLRYRPPDGEFEIPVYLTDSVLLPGQSRVQRDLFAADAVSFPMTVGTFNVPREVVDARAVPQLMNILHDAVSEKRGREAFVADAISQLGLPKSDNIRTTLSKLFDDMKHLDDRGENRIWTKLIRNRYAALFFKNHFDFIVGNPPHVNWESLTTEWRKAAEYEYRRYGLFTLKGLESRHGGGKKDIAALFTYAVLDHFGRPDCTLALVVHVSLFKTSGAGEGFRRFYLGDRQLYEGGPFRVEEAHDFSSFQPFATRPGMKIKTRTVTFRARKGKRTSYPVPYMVWHKTTRGIIPGDETWDEALERLESNEYVATPLRGTSIGGILTPWLTVRKKDLAACTKVIAPINYEPYYTAHEGANSAGLNGAFFVRVLERYPNGTALIENIFDTGKIRCPKIRAVVEADLLYPLLRGRSIRQWIAEPEDHILMVQDPKAQRGYPEEWMRRTHPLALKYLRHFEKLLRERKAFKKFFDENRDPFYSMYSVAEYTFAPHKVVWMDISDTMKAAAVTGGRGNNLVVPEHTAIFVEVDSAEEAHYLAAVLNSEPIVRVVEGYIVDNHLSTHVVENVVIPRYEKRNEVHHRLSLLGESAHNAAKHENQEKVEQITEAINEIVGRLW